jgi:calcium permeable stress-gated cation channel
MICRYFLFLLVNVVFIFLLASTYWQLVRDLANSPAKIPEKLAQALQIGRARLEGSQTSVERQCSCINRHFFLSYVILQGGLLVPCYTYIEGKLKSFRARYHAVAAS